MLDSSPSSSSLVTRQVVTHDANGHTSAEPSADTHSPVSSITAFSSPVSPILPPSPVHLQQGHRARGHAALSTVGSVTQSSYNEPHHPSSTPEFDPFQRPSPPSSFVEYIQEERSRRHRRSQQMSEKHISEQTTLSSSPAPPQDLEKASYYDHLPRSEHRSSGSHSQHTTVYYNDVEVGMEDEDEDDEDPRDHALWILTYLSVLAPLLALTFSLYTCIATTLLLLSHPFTRFLTHVPLASHLHRFLTPPLTFQLGLIYHPASSPQQPTNHAAHHSSPYSRQPSSNPKPKSTITPILINIFSPCWAFCIMIAAWVAAGFWFFGAILGDPSDTHTPSSCAERRGGSGGGGRVRLSSSSLPTSSSGSGSPDRHAGEGANEGDGRAGHARSRRRRRNRRRRRSRKEGYDSDGKEAVLWVSRWWGAWLAKGVAVAVAVG